MPLAPPTASTSLVRRLFWPAWFDEARFIVQRPVFDRVLAGVPFGGRVLNAGCGEGLYAPLIEQYGGVRAIVNMDLHTPRIARSRADRRHRDSQGSLDALPFADRAFDAVVCTEVLEHVPADRDAVAELARVLKPGGTLLVSVPTPPAPFDPAHVREGYTLPELTALLSSAGFEPMGSGFCLHGVMRATYRAWQWQHGVARRNLFPRIVLRSAAHLDRALPFGSPWDLAVAARKRAV